MYSRRPFFRVLSCNVMLTQKLREVNGGEFFFNIWCYRSYICRISETRSQLFMKILFIFTLQIQSCAYDSFHWKKKELTNSCHCVIQERTSQIRCNTITIGIGNMEGPLGCRSFSTSSKNGNARAPLWLTFWSRRWFSCILILICLHFDRFGGNIWYLFKFVASILLRIFSSTSSCYWWLASGESIVPNVSGWSLSPEWVCRSL